jgi:hypothetical protein
MSRALVSPERQLVVSTGHTRRVRWLIPDRDKLDPARTLMPTASHVLDCAVSPMVAQAEAMARSCTSYFQIVLIDVADAAPPR